MIPHDDSSNGGLLGTCPTPRSRYDQILLGHGSGGQLSAELIGRLFLPAFSNDVLGALEDQATLEIDGTGAKSPRLAFTTDSFVVQPLFFPGGDIGRLAVHGTVNDLAVGGRPAALPGGGVHPRRGPAACRPEPDRRLDARGVRRGGGCAGDRRYEGRR